MSAQFNRILCVRLSAIGDVINTLPAVTAIRGRFPSAFIGFVVEDRCADVVVGHPDLDRVFVFERRKISICPWLVIRHIQRIRRERFDVVLDFQGNLKGALHARLSGAPRRIGFARGHCREFNYLFSNVHVSPPGLRIHRVEKFMALAKEIDAPAGPLARPDGVVEDGNSQPRFKLPPLRASEEIRRLVDAFAGRTYVVIHPGTSAFGATKRWPAEQFGALAKSFARETGMGVIVSWGPGERTLAEETVRHSDGAATMCAATPGLLDLAFVIRGARAFVSADTGPGHLAAAVGTPCVAIFGPKDPEVYAPYIPTRRVVRRGNVPDAVAPEEVLRALKELLAESGR